ncbi:MAG: hypothetical protein IPH32_11025 [Bacteroidetes bacterium]|jgi:hypothetical protein|nr:hypothetical protein [Bacteroidota bacterium]
MKKIKSLATLLLTIAFFSTSQCLFSQESNSNRGGEKSRGTTKTRVSNADNNNSNVQKRVDTNGKSFQLDENDAYQGRTEEFLSQITLKELPQDFPKYEKWMGVRHYNEIISDYYKKHLDILIPSVKQKLTQTH